MILDLKLKKEFISYFVDLHNEISIQRLFLLINKLIKIKEDEIKEIVENDYHFEIIKGITIYKTKKYIIRKDKRYNFNYEKISIDDIKKIEDIFKINKKVSFYDLYIKHNQKQYKNC